MNGIELEDREFFARLPNSASQLERGPVLAAIIRSAPSPTAQGRRRYGADLYEDERRALLVVAAPQGRNCRTGLRRAGAVVAIDASVERAARVTSLRCPIF
jgi:hypothetical protein